MRKQTLINDHTAICTGCGQFCEPVIQSLDFDYEGPEGRGVHRGGIEYWSDCCEEKMEDMNGVEWFPEFGESEPPFLIEANNF